MRRVPNPPRGIIPVFIILVSINHLKTISLVYEKFEDKINKEEEETEIERQRKRAEYLIKELKT